MVSIKSKYFRGGDYLHMYIFIHLFIYLFIYIYRASGIEEAGFSELRAGRSGS